MAEPQDLAMRSRDPSSPGPMTVGQMCADFARREADLRRRARRMGLSRREFLAALAAGAVASAADARRAAEALGLAAGARPARSRVVVVTHPEVLIKDYRVNLPVVRAMLDRAVVELTGRRTEAAAWADLAHEGDRVAVKYNGLHAPTLHTHPEVLAVLKERLTGPAGVDPKAVLAVDRHPPPPYDEFSEPFTLPSRGLTTRLRRLYTDYATAVVNVSVLKSHFTDGISAALKNHLGSVNNPAAYHGWEPDRMPRSLPELSALEPLRAKTRLVVIDAVRPLCAGGPVDDPAYRWDFRGLIVARDPVAATAVGLQILEARRREVRGKPWPMTAARTMLGWAEAIGLGWADPARIDRADVAMG